MRKRDTGEPSFFFSPESLSWWMGKNPLLKILFPKKKIYF
jgi:hypothetical protein